MSKVYQAERAEEEIELTEKIRAMKQAAGPDELMQDKLDASARSGNTAILGWIALMPAIGFGLAALIKVRLELFVAAVIFFAISFRFIMGDHKHRH